MRYYTNFYLKVYPENAKDEFIDNYLEIDENYPFDCDSVNFSKRDYSDVIKKVSASLPGVVIVIDGEGESAGDVWREVWLNGEIVLDWQLDATLPEIPKEFLDQARYSDEEYLKKQALAKLSEKEKSCLDWGNKMIKPDEIRQRRQENLDEFGRNLSIPEIQEVIDRMIINGSTGCASQSKVDLTDLGYAISDLIGKKYPIPVIVDAIVKSKYSEYWNIDVQPREFYYMEYYCWCNLIFSEKTKIEEK